MKNKHYLIVLIKTLSVAIFSSIIIGLFAFDIMERFFGDGIILVGLYTSPLLITLVYVIVKWNDYKEPWVYLAIGSIPFIIDMAITFCFACIDFDIRLIEYYQTAYGWQILFYVVAKIASYLCIVFLDVLIGTVLTIKRRKAKKQEQNE